MKCPKCESAKLNRIRIDQIEVDHCDACGGLWLDQSELSRLLESDTAELKKLGRGRIRVAADQARGDCPRCGTNLLRVASAQRRRITLDKCPDCDGVWLDGGELRALASSSQ